jgi:hypothetical protein
MRRCNRCMTVKDESEFYKTKWIKGGVVEWCKQCRKEYGIEYREKNREQIAARKREWARKNRDHVNRMQVERLRRKKEMNND